MEHITALIAGAGYFGVTVLMALESMIAPVPGEAVLPFAGLLIVEGQFTFAGVVFFSTLGSIIGSLLSYYIGAWGEGRLCGGSADTSFSMRNIWPSPSAYSAGTVKA